MLKIVLIIVLILILIILPNVSRGLRINYIKAKPKPIVEKVEAPVDKKEKLVIVTEKEVNRSRYLYKPVEYVNTGKYTKYINIDKYDDYFRKYTKMYFGYGFDYNWFKAQAIAESNLAMRGTNESISSPVGARGIMQIMPRTWDEIVASNDYMKGHSVIEAEYNIAGGIFYDYKMSKIWDNNSRPFEDWLAFIFASYNAGAGNIIKAQRLVKGEDPNLWVNVLKKLSLVTGNHSKETEGYVIRIFEIKGDLR